MRARREQRPGRLQPQGRGHDPQQGEEGIRGPDDRGAIEIELRGEASSRSRLGRRRSLGSRGSRPEPSTTVAIPISLNPEDGAGPVGPFDVVACVRAQGDEGIRSCRAAAGALTVTPATPPNFSPGARASVIRSSRRSATAATTRSTTRSTSTTTPRRTLRRRDVDDDHRSGHPGPLAFSLDFQRDLTVVRGDGRRRRRRLRSRSTRRRVRAERRRTSRRSWSSPRPPGSPTGREFRSRSTTPATPSRSPTPTSRSRAGSGLSRDRAAATAPSPSTSRSARRAGSRRTTTRPTRRPSTPDHRPRPHDRRSGPASSSARRQRRRDDDLELVEDDPTATYLATATVGHFDYSDGTMTERRPAGRPDLHADRLGRHAGGRGPRPARARPTPSMIELPQRPLGPYPFDSIGSVADWPPASATRSRTRPSRTTRGNARTARRRRRAPSSTRSPTSGWATASRPPLERHLVQRGLGDVRRALYSATPGGGADRPQQFFDDVYAHPGED